MEKFCCVVSWAADVCRDGHRSCILQGKVTKLNFVAMCHRQQSYGFKCGWRHSTCCGANSVASSWLRKGWVPFNKTFLKFFLFFKAVELSLLVRVTLYGCGCTPFIGFSGKHIGSALLMIDQDDSKFKRTFATWKTFALSSSCTFLLWIVLYCVQQWFGVKMSLYITHFPIFFGQGWLSSVWCFPFCWIPAGSAALSQVTPRSLAEGCSSQSGGCYLWTVWI